MHAQIERRESGPAWMDKTSDLYGPDVDSKESEDARRELAHALDSAVATGDANTLCSFATVTDWDLVNRQPIDQRSAIRLPRRAMTLTEVLMEAVSGYPEVESQLVQLLLNACRSTDPMHAEQAKALRAHIANKWVEVAQ